MTAAITYVLAASFWFICGWGLGVLAAELAFDEDTFSKRRRVK